MTMTASVEADGGLLGHRERLIVIGGLVSGLLLSALDNTIVATALPTIVGEFGGIDHLSWVVTAYLLSSTAVMPLYGKISDLYGRRTVFQAAIVIFLSGSVFCGIAQNLGQLIAFRALQGVGGGGLMALAFTIVGDIVPPRERGRYNGYLTGTFAFASVAGPLVGGFFVDHLNWRWIFYINIPFGVAALMITTAVLKLPFRRSEHRIDVLGAALLVSAVVCLLLVAVWGGQEYAWGSPAIIGLALSSIVLGVLFVLQERAAAEPILPLRLFSMRVFTVSVLVSVLVGMSMYGTTVFIPLFLQAVRETSATNSGLLLLPMMMSLLAMSITIGRLISKTGRYRVFPIIGTAVLMSGMVVLSQLDAGSGRVHTSIGMALVGLGMGTAMPTLTVAVQNAVEPRDMGAGTSALNFFRTLGGTLGVAGLGAVLSARVDSLLTGRLPDVASLDTDALVSSPSAIHALEPALRTPVVASLADAIGDVFLVAAPLAATAFVVAWFMEELPLKVTATVTSAPPE